jgi:hypothetical protein
MMAERKAEALETGAAKVFRLLATTVASAWFGVFLTILSVGEGLSTVDRLPRLSWERMWFVLFVALVPLCFGAVTAQMARPHSPAVPAGITAALLLGVGLGVYADDPFQAYLYALVAAPAYLTGAALHARHLERKALRERYAARRSAPETRAAR